VGPRDTHNTNYADDSNDSNYADDSNYANYADDADDSDDSNNTHDSDDSDDSYDLTYNGTPDPESIDQWRWLLRGDVHRTRVRLRQPSGSSLWRRFHD
jgi:hypothetical protein